MTKAILGVDYRRTRLLLAIDHASVGAGPPVTVSQLQRPVIFAGLAAKDLAQSVHHANLCSGQI